MYGNFCIGRSRLMLHDQRIAPLIEYRIGGMRLARCLVVVFLLVSACAGTETESQASPSSEPGPQSGSALDDPRECSAEKDSALDVEGEPDWRQYADYTPWTDVDGCLVRIDVLAERPGPDHCGWEDSRVIITGDPFETRYTDGSMSVEYVRDPNGVYEIPAFVDGFRVLDSLPDDAVDTGYRQGTRELWISSADPEAIFIRGEASVERWPRGDVPGCL